MDAGGISRVTMSMQRGWLLAPRSLPRQGGHETEPRDEASVQFMFLMHASSRGDLGDLPQRGGPPLPLGLRATEIVATNYRHAVCVSLRGDISIVYIETASALSIILDCCLELRYSHLSSRGMTMLCIPSLGAFFPTEP